MEIITLRRKQVRLDLATGAHVEPRGKGRKERALETLAPMPGMSTRYRADDKLLAFLKTL